MNMDYIEAWKEIMQRPSDFYREMPKLTVIRTETDVTAHRK